MKTRDLRVESIRPLLPPAILLEELPLSEDASQVITRARDEVAEILAGSDDRLIVIVGPCSVHDPAAAACRSRSMPCAPWPIPIASSASPSKAWPASSPRAATPTAT